MYACVNESLQRNRSLLDWTLPQPRRVYSPFAITHKMKHLFRMSITPTTPSPGGLYSTNMVSRRIFARRISRFDRPLSFKVKQKTSHLVLSKVCPTLLCVFVQFHCDTMENTKYSRRCRLRETRVDRTVDYTACVIFIIRSLARFFPQGTRGDTARNACTRGEWLLWLVEGNMRWPLLLVAVLLRHHYLDESAAWCGTARRRPL